MPVGSKTRRGDLGFRLLAETTVSTPLGSALPARPVRASRGLVCASRANGLLTICPHHKPVRMDKIISVDL